MARRLLLIPIVLLAAACDTGDGRQLREPTAAQRAAMTTTTSTSSTVPFLPGEVIENAPTVMSAAPVGAFTLEAPWPDGGVIDARFTCDGAGVSPRLAWSAPPAGTAELALVVIDPDAEGFIHWAVAGIPPVAGSVEEGADVVGGFEGQTGFGSSGWGGPCPPTPDETHQYRFALYALGQQNELPEGFTGDELLELASSTAIAVAEVTGTYTRAG